jgi:hypothetical protein
MISMEPLLSHKNHLTTPITSWWQVLVVLSCSNLRVAIVLWMKGSFQMKSQGSPWQRLQWKKGLIGLDFNGLVVWHGGIFSMSHVCWSFPHCFYGWFPLPWVYTCQVTCSGRWWVHFKNIHLMFLACVVLDFWYFTARSRLPFMLVYTR